MAYFLLFGSQFAFFLLQRGFPFAQLFFKCLEFKFFDLNCFEGCSVAGEPWPEDSEQLVRRFFTRAEIEGLLDAGRFADAFTALCLAYWLRRTARPG